MLDTIEVNAVDADYSWIEVDARDQLNDANCLVHLVIQDAQDMVYAFTQRYLAKQTITFNFADSAMSALREFFQEARLAQVMYQEGKPLGELPVMLRTQGLSFTNPEKSTLRKSKAARVRLYLDEAYQAMQKHFFQRALQLLNWVHILDANNEMAFELRIVCLRSAKKISECVAVLEEWIQAYPDRLEARIGLGEVWLYLDQDNKARACFQEILALDTKNSMALVGLAQAKARLGEDYLGELTKAFLVDSSYVKEIVEHVFDFRAKDPDSLEARPLNRVAEHYGIPIKRLLGRAQRGVLPFHPPSQGGLLRFSKVELDRYYDALRKLGLEIRSRPLDNASSDQLSLFEGEP